MSPVKRRLVAGVVLLLAATAVTLHAHDFWIEPSTYQPQPGETVALRFRVGEHFRGEEIPRDPSRIVSFVHRGPKKPGPIPGITGYGPAGLLAVDAPGRHLVGYHSTSSFVELEADKFEEYLRQEGLEKIIEQRKRIGESEAPGKELFARCVKSLLSAGVAGAATVFNHTFGFPLELVLDDDPYLLQGGAEISVRLLRNGKPLKDALVVAYADADPAKPHKVRTDGEGRAVFPLKETGPWLIKTVHMERINHDEADWQSWWASLTFEIR